MSLTNILLLKYMSLSNIGEKNIYRKEAKRSVISKPMYKVKGKMIKHQLLLKRSKLRPHLPETHWLTASRAMKMLKSSSTIFLKPNGGSGGTGIIKIRRTHHGYIFANGQKRRYVSRASLYKALQYYEKSHKKYIVQRGIKLASYKGKIFDVRMYLQKPKKVWKISGKVARIAAPNHYVTNQHQGGYAKKLEKVLSTLFANKKRKVNKCKKKLRRIALTAAKTLDKRFPDIHELGIDLAIEKGGHVWFIEANSRPAHRLFAQLSDKTMLYRIKRNKRFISSKARRGHSH